MVLQFFTDHSEDCKSKKSQRNRWASKGPNDSLKILHRKPKKESVTTSFRDTSEDNNQNENDSPKPVQRQGSYSGSFNEAKKGFANMADELAKNKKFNKSRQSIDAGDTSMAQCLERLEKKNGNGGGGSPDFVVPKLKPVDPNSKPVGNFGEKRKSFVPLPERQKSTEETVNPGKDAKEKPVIPSPGGIS